MTLLRRSLERRRIHSGYLLAGDADAAREAALEFARALVCSASESARRPCETCRACVRSAGPATDEKPIEIDGTGKRGPLFRHIGDHADLFWVDRGRDSTRVRVEQVRALQAALRFGSHEGGHRVVVIADAEQMNDAAQNALLRLLEEPPPETTLLLSTASVNGLLVTIRSRCQRVVFPVPRAAPLRSDAAPEAVRAIALRLDRASQAPLAELLDWAEEYRGERALAAEGVQLLLATSAEWLRERATAAAREGRRDLHGELAAFRTLQRCRKDLAQRNANPQMVAERALFALQTAAGGAR
ncbi:MAG: hypothetical protein VX681_15320 [Myxococcota bacterium]|nr:hypothetical protein [Myxococcota bacterium]